MPAGKIVDHFVFKRHGRVFQVPVRMHKDAERHEGSGSSRYAGPQQTRSVIFGVDLDNPKIRLWSTDIEALRSSVMDALADHYKIAWEEWWIVEVGEGYMSFDDGGTSLELTWHSCRIGKTPEGETVHTVSRYGGGDDILKGWPETTSGRGRRKGATAALVRATEENTKALDEFAKRLKLLRKRVMEFLSPQQIANSLQRIGGLLQPQLPAPKAKAVAVEEMVPHTPEVTTKSPKRKLRKGEKPLLEIRKPTKMRRCKGV